MPKFIPNRHVRRMFPFDFFNELSQTLPEFIPENPAFLLQDTAFQDKLGDNQQDLFETLRKQVLDNTKIEQNNLYKLDQGTFLILETYVKKKDQYKAIKHEPTAKYLLLAQLFDSSQQPVFAEDVAIESIRTIPEILWDDPNLVLAILQIMPDPDDNDEILSELGFVKGPQFFMNALLEDVNDDK